MRAPRACRPWSVRAATLLFGAVLAGWCGAAHALTTCTVAATAVAFGQYNRFSPSATSSNGTISVSCSLAGLLSLLVSYQIRLSTGHSGQYATRRLASGGEFLAYNLYLDDQPGVVWGDGSGTSGVRTDGYLLGLGTTVRQYTVNGRMPPLQPAAPGSYADTIVVTVEYN